MSEQFFYESFLIKDGEPDGPMFEKHDKPYAERYAEWQAEEDAKSTDVLLDECRARAYQAVDHIMRGCRNAPRTTLERELARGVALQGILEATKKGASITPFLWMLKQIPPVQGPPKTFYDMANEAAQDLANKMDRMIMGRVADELA